MKKQVKITYPTFRSKTGPTPPNKFVVCPKCVSSYWTIFSDLQSYCHQGCGRMMNGSKEEYKEAKRILHSYWEKEMMKIYKKNKFSPNTEK